MNMITLNNGIQMPMLGFGTFLTGGAECEESVLAALRSGGRGIIGTNQRKPSKIKGLQMI